MFMCGSKHASQALFSPGIQRFNHMVIQKHFWYSLGTRQLSIIGVLSYNTSRNNNVLGQ